MTLKNRNISEFDRYVIKEITGITGIDKIMEKILIGANQQVYLLFKTPVEYQTDVFEAKRPIYYMEPVLSKKAHGIFVRPVQNKTGLICG